MKRAIWAFTIATVLILAVIASIYGAPYISMRTPSGFWGALSWRSQVYFMKVTGDIPELSWADLWMMTTTKTGFGLEEVVKSGLSVHTALQNAYVNSEDNKAGAHIFNMQCSTCHGENGK